MNKKEPQIKLAELSQQLREGTINRREFFHMLKILGLSAGATEILAACGVQPTPMPYPTAYQPGGSDSFIFPTEKENKGLFGNGKRTATQDVSVQAGELIATPQPDKKISWLCVSCGKSFPDVEKLQEHALEMHSKRLPEIRRVEKPTYSEFIVGPVERFDERNVAFSRLSWDTEYQEKFMAAVEKGQASLAKLTPEEQWAAQEGQALVAGAIYVDDTAGTFAESYTGYNGHMKDTAGLYGWEDKINPQKYPVNDPAWMAERIKTVARFYGADLVGITKVNPAWVYSHYFDSSTGDSGPVVMNYQYAIVMGVEMAWDEINKSPKYEASAATALGYSRMSELSASLAKYIRMLGYPALPCGNDTAQSIPLAIDAGLGEHGRNGLLLTPEFGPRQRLCKVFTSLPLQTDLPIDFGSGSYCDKCHACASSCPARAIPKGDRTAEPTSISNRTGIKRWTVNVSDCLLFWQTNGGTDCSNCISSCPWALRSLRDWLET